jgi:signal transduction histidine kinase
MFKLSYRRKVLYAFCSLALLPLILLAFFSITNLQSVEEKLRVSAIEALDDQAAEMLELRAIMVAGEVTTFLRDIEDDLAALGQMEPTVANYLWFSSTHRREIWVRAGSNESPREERPSVPLYKELTFISPDGTERLRIVDSEVAAELRDVSKPANTTFLTETYFEDTLDRPPGQLHVSRVTGWHVSKAEQLQGAENPEEAVVGQQYDGVVRFSSAVYNDVGELLGVVVLSLDHRHLMEFTQHISPLDERFVVFPSYQSGNYSFMFDDEGWIITHPKFWDIRGLDRQGQLVPAYTSETSPEDIAAGIIPYNLSKAAFIHPNYPLVHNFVRQGTSGVVDVTNVGGSRKIMAYAPIFYDRGVYAERGVFGGITIGAEVRLFHKTAEQASARIRRLFTGFVSGAWTLVGLTALLVVLAAYKLSNSITAPLSGLISGTEQMARGKLSTRVEIESPTEVAALAQAFNTMAAQLNERRERLLRTLADLRRSRHLIQREKDFKETIVENVEAGILTLDNEDRVSSLNGPAREILRLDDPGLQIPLDRLLIDWPELLVAIANGADQVRWSEYVSVERDGQVLTYRLTLHALASRRTTGRIQTIEDLTERVNLRQQMARIERLASLGRLSAGIAHEVRNPLTGISLLLDELHDRLLSQPSDRALIQRALQEIERLEGLVNELLTFASQPEKRLGETDIAEIMRDILFLVGKQCQKHQIELRQDIPATLPHLRADADRLKQAFLNLLTNALDAMSTGGVLSVTVALHDEVVRIDISDTGAGFPTEKASLIFEPFYTTKGEGTGLGLSITHTIIANHNGRIEVQSQPDQGSTFTIFLPLAGQNQPYV